jgi:exopolyphosphatase/guanosine-5'-triphosphate,3'-diphosphate pyrophosphatase
VSRAAGRVAALDLGTNTFLALVAELDARGELCVVHDAYRTPRLGEGLARTGRMSEPAMARGIAALHELLAGVRSTDVAPERVRAVGTAVFRRAANAAEFVERARRECGVEIDIASGEREGELSFVAAAGAARGAGHDAQVTPSDVRVIDVGGGSTEIAWAGGAERVSAPVGAVVLTERYLDAGAESAWSDAAWSAAEKEVAEALAGALGGRSLPAREAGETVALGGTAANLAALEAGSSAFDARRTEGQRVTAAGARQWAERLRGIDAAGRRRFPVEVERAGILPAGLLCLAAALELLGTARARASGRGLRYGLAWKMLQGEA